MIKAITKENMALLKEASEMFNETDCVPGIDGEQVPGERIVPDAKEYISETIDDPETIYDPKIWDTPGFALVLSWLAQKWHRRCRKLAPHGSKSPEQYLTKEQQEACLDSAAVEINPRNYAGTAIELSQKTVLAKIARSKRSNRDRGVHQAVSTATRRPEREVITDARWKRGIIPPLHE